MSNTARVGACSSRKMACELLSVKLVELASQFPGEGLDKLLAFLRLRQMRRTCDYLTSFLLAGCLTVIAAPFY